jgi:hypothetical protein
MERSIRSWLPSRLKQGMASVGRNQTCRVAVDPRPSAVAGCVEAFRGPSWRTSPMLRQAINDVDALIELYEWVAELPGLDLNCQLRLPRLLSPELERRSAEEIQRALPPTLAQVDNPVVRADLARCSPCARRRVGERVAADALLDLDRDDDALVRAPSSPLSLWTAVPHAL